MAEDFRQIEAMLQKLEHGHIHIAVFGRVSVGKSALLNALLGKDQFSTSPLHGETRQASHAQWEAYDAGGVYLIDTPGINEIAGEEREQMAHEVASRSDLVIFVVDGDVTDTELHALRVVTEENRPVLLVLNKTDRYTLDERELLIKAISDRVQGLVPGRQITTAAAAPATRTYILQDTEGNEIEELRQPPLDIAQVRQLLWEILEREGKTLAALNASLFAGKLSDSVTRKIIELRKSIAQKLIQNYCLAKGILVAVNPVPVSDLIAAIAVDSSMIVHLSYIYGLPMTRRQSGKLITTIFTQLGLLMGTVWATHLLSSVLKGSTFGLSTILTASAQGAVAWYATYIVGKSAEYYFQHGKSWGEGGPKQVVNRILDGIDKDSMLQEARASIRGRIKSIAE